ncbi:MAG: hypothetical protein CM15mV78_380 [uncultured marine virus]|nr:MAG: hypothetical protein CM15mV78_380 [uncultured marine virus]
MNLNNLSNRQAMVVAEASALEMDAVTQKKAQQARMHKTFLN